MAFTPVYYTDPDFVVQRQYCQALAWGWWDHTLISNANPFVTEEIPYGGYETHIKLEPNFYAFSSSQWRLGDVIDDIWSIDPNTQNVVNAGTIVVEFKYIPECRIFAIVLSASPSDGHYSFTRLPTAPASYWYHPDPRPDWEYQYRPPSLSSTPCTDLLPVT